MNWEDEKKDGRLSGAMRIFEALSSVDEELLERSETSPKVVPFRKYAKVMAACVCIVILGTAVFAGRSMFSVKNSTSSDCAAEEQQFAADADGAGYGAAQEAAEDAAAEGIAEEGVTEAEQEKNRLTESLQNGSEESDTGMIAGSQMTSDINELQNEQELLEKNEQDDGLLWDMEPSFVSDLVSDPLDEAAIRATEELGAYLPTELPAGYVYESGYRTGEADGAESISVLWSHGMDTIHISISRYEESEEMQERLADISRPETYDVYFYEIPYCDSVPEEYYMTFHYPIFRESDFCLDIVKMRMMSVSDQGDTDTPRGSFAVLYDGGVLVEFNGDGDAESIWNMFQSIAP